MTDKKLTKITNEHFPDNRQLIDLVDLEHEFETLRTVIQDTPEFKGKFGFRYAQNTGAQFMISHTPGKDSAIPSTATEWSFFPLRATDGTYGVTKRHFDCSGRKKVEIGTGKKSRLTAAMIAGDFQATLRRMEPSHHAVFDRLFLAPAQEQEMEKPASGSPSPSV